ncbi:MAG TPA: hypothetical protein VMW10_06240, partial [Alphaproteobacteria bacterium]|nr:hypothetical protein [Alphaproteobacteria bacterium]
MVHRKYSLLFILTLLFAQSAHAAGSSISALEESCCTTFSTARINQSAGKKTVKQFNLKDFPNMQFNDVPSVGKGKEKVENRKSGLRDLLENWHQGLNSSQEQSTNFKTLDYLRENKKPIAIFEDMMDSGFILSENDDGLALRMSDSKVYVIIPNPGKKE